MEYQDGSLGRRCHGHDLAEVPRGRGSGGSGRCLWPLNLPVGLLNGCHAGGCHSQVASKYGGSQLIDPVFVHDIPPQGQVSGHAVRPYGPSTAPSRPDTAPHAPSQPKRSAPERVTGLRVSECLGSCPRILRPTWRNSAYRGLANALRQVLPAMQSFNCYYRPLPAAFPEHSIAA